MKVHDIVRISRHSYTAKPLEARMAVAHDSHAYIDPPISTSHTGAEPCHLGVRRCMHTLHQCVGQWGLSGWEEEWKVCREELG